MVAAFRVWLVDEGDRARVREAHARVVAAEAARAERDGLVRELLASGRATRKEVAQELGISVEAVRRIVLRGDRAPG